MELFEVGRISTHDYNMMWHVVIIFGIYSDRKLPKKKKKRHTQRRQFVCSFALSIIIDKVL